MQTHTVTTYSFTELSEEAKKKVLRSDLQTINVDFDWWFQTYEDIESLGLKCTEFDIERRTIKLQIVTSYADVIERMNKATWLPVRLQEYKLDPAVLEDDDRLEVETENLLREFRIIFMRVLRDEYYYCISDEAIAETLIANDYQFTEYGTMFNPRIYTTTQTPTKS